MEHIYKTGIDASKRVPKVEGVVDGSSGGVSVEKGRTNMAVEIRARKRFKRSGCMKKR